MSTARRIIVAGLDAVAYSKATLFQTKHPGSKRKKSLYDAGRVAKKKAAKQARKRSRRRVS